MASLKQLGTVPFCHVFKSAIIAYFSMCKRGLSPIASARLSRQSVPHPSAPEYVLMWVTVLHTLKMSACNTLTPSGIHSYAGGCVTLWREKKIRIIFNRNGQNIRHGLIPSGNSTLKPNEILMLADQIVSPPMFVYDTLGLNLR